MEEIVRDAVLQVPPFLCTVAQTRTLFGRPPWVEPCSSKLRDSLSSRGFTLDLPEWSEMVGWGGEEREKGGEERKGLSIVTIGPPKELCVPKSCNHVL